MKEVDPYVVDKYLEALGVRNWKNIVQDRKKMNDLLMATKTLREPKNNNNRSRNSVPNFDEVKVSVGPNVRLVTT